MLELEELVKQRVNDALSKQGYTKASAEIAYGVDNPDIRVLLVDFYKEVKDPREAVAAIKWALDFGAENGF